MKDCQCSHCKKRFDYGNYYGICPKCGTYNRKGATAVQREEEIIGSTSRLENCQIGSIEKSQTGMKLLIYCVSAVLLIAAVCYVPIRCFMIEQDMQNFRKDRNLTPIVWDATKPLERPNATIKLLRAVELIPANTKSQFPEDKKLIGIQMEYIPKEQEDFGNAQIAWGVPFIDGEDQFYKTAVAVWDVEPLLMGENETSIPLLDSYCVYSYQEENGYFTYLVEKDMTSVTVFVRLMESYEGESFTQLPKEVYQLTLPIEKGEVQ